LTSDQVTRLICVGRREAASQDAPSSSAGLAEVGLLDCDHRDHEQGGDHIGNSNRFAILLLHPSVAVIFDAVLGFPARSASETVPHGNDRRADCDGSCGSAYPEGTSHHTFLYHAPSFNAEANHPSIVDRHVERQHKNSDPD